MPIEVKELIIRTTISEGTSQGSLSQQPSLKKDLIIQDAVDKVMEIHDKKKKR